MDVFATNGRSADKMSIFGTPEERKRRREQKGGGNRANPREAKAKSACVLEGYYAITRTPCRHYRRARNHHRQCHGARHERRAKCCTISSRPLTQLYSDCMYHSFRLEATISSATQPDWPTIKDDASETLHAGNLLFAYLKEPQWKQMNSALSTLRVYSVAYASGQPSTTHRNKLRQAADEIYNTACLSYQYDGRIFERWESLTKDEIPFITPPPLPSPIP